MDLFAALSVLAITRRLKRHDRFSRAELLAYQSTRLARLREFARSRSRLYAQLHDGLDDAPLEELPAVTKQLLRERFDDVVTDARVSFAALQRYVSSTDGREPFAGRFRVNLTSGASGRPTMAVFSSRDWAWAMASYARGQTLSGLDPLRRARMALVASPSPWHASSQVAITAGSAWIPTLRVPATAPLHEIVAALDGFAPDVLVGYASMIRVLADEQAAGRLSISPARVFSASEVLTPGMRRAIESAFAAEVFDEYGASETGLLAAECELHRMHLFEDMAVVEPVDVEGRPVAAGIAADRVLVTPLWARTLPLIRYEVKDRLVLDDEPCPCGRPYRVLARVEGRGEDLLVLSGEAGPLSLHPVIFHAVLDELDVAGWQVVLGPREIRVLVARPGVSFSIDEVSKRLQDLLARRGIVTSMTVEVVAAIPRTASGKAPFVRRDLAELA